MARTMTAAALLSLVAACESPEAVHLWNPKTDHVVTCEPLADHAPDAKDVAAKLAACVEHYKGLGFIELLAP